MLTLDQIKEYLADEKRGFSSDTPEYTVYAACTFLAEHAKSPEEFLEKVETNQQDMREDAHEPEWKEARVKAYQRVIDHVQH